MFTRSNYCIVIAGFIVVLIAMGFAPCVFGFEAKKKVNSLDSLEFTANDLYISQTQIPIDKVITRLPNMQAWNSFLLMHADGMVYIDPRSGRPVSLTQVFPLIPGTGQGNTITFEELSIKLGYRIEKLSNELIRNLAMQFIREHIDILNIRMDEIGDVKVTNTDRNYLWDVFITRKLNGIPVRDANISLSINHGNISLWGVEKWGDVDINLFPEMNDQQALLIGFTFIGGQTASDTIIKRPQLEIIPIAPQWDGTIGIGYEHALVWSFIFKREGYVGTWEILIDAHTGKVIARYRHILLS